MAATPASQSFSPPDPRAKPREGGFSSRFSARHPKLPGFTVENYGYGPCATASPSTPRIGAEEGPTEGDCWSPRTTTTPARSGTKQPKPSGGVQLRGYYYQDTRRRRNLAGARRTSRNARRAGSGVYSFLVSRAVGSSTRRLCSRRPVDLPRQRQPITTRKSPKWVQLVDKVPPWFRSTRQDGGELNDATANTSPARSAHRVPRHRVR